MISHRNQFIKRPIPSKVILWGGTGQAIELRPIIQSYGSDIEAIFDDTVGLKSPFFDVPVYQGKESFDRWLTGVRPSEFGFCVAVGNPNAAARLAIHEFLLNKGLKPITVAHPSAWIDETVIIGEGTTFLAGVVVDPMVRIGRCCIIDPNATISHECVLEDGVEIGPGATLCGLIKVESKAFVGAGATILPRVTIGSGAIVGVGAAVIGDVEAGVTVIGNPARQMSRKWR